MGHLESMALQANDAHQGDLSGGYAIPGIGLSFYNADGTNQVVEIITYKGTTVLYNNVPEGAQILTPLFKEIGANTTSTDLTVAYHKHPLA